MDWCCAVCLIEQSAAKRYRNISVPITIRCIAGGTPEPQRNAGGSALNFNSYRWQRHWGVVSDAGRGVTVEFTRDRLVPINEPPRCGNAVEANKQRVSPIGD